MGEILIFQNDPLVGLGTLEEVLARQCVDYRCVRLFDGEIPDSCWEEIRGLIVLGGHMSINDEIRYPYLRWEKTILRMAIKQDLVMLGISLGAQLIAYAAGAKVYQGRFKEIGWYPISLTVEGQFDPLMGRLPERVITFQWNNGGVELPAAASRLASSSYFKNAAFRLGKNIYGVNFHLETTPQLIDTWIDRYGRDLGESPYLSADKIKADTVSYGQSFKHYGERFFMEFARRLPTGRSQARLGNAG